MAQTDIRGEYLRHEENGMVQDERNHDKTVLLLAEEGQGPGPGRDAGRDWYGCHNAGLGDGLPAQLPSFVELKPPAQPCCSCDVDTPADAPDAPLTLNLKDCQLQIRGNASESLLRMVVKVLRDA